MHLLWINCKESGNLVRTPSSHPLTPTLPPSPHITPTPTNLALQHLVYEPLALAQESGGAAVGLVRGDTEESSWKTGHLPEKQQSPTPSKFINTSYIF